MKTWLKVLVMAAQGMLLAALLGSAPALAQVPVVDSANLTQAQQIAATTNNILTQEQGILTQTTATLNAVTGSRTSVAQGSLAQMALGGGFSMANAPSLGSVMSGGALSFTGLGGNSQSIVSSLINGLQLVKSITGLINGQVTTGDQAYMNSVNTSATVAGLVNSTQSALTARSSAFTSGGGSIGTAPDLKGSVDQNTQVQIQTGQTVNELIGAVATTTTAANQANLDRIAIQSQAAAALAYKAAGQ